MDTNTDKKISVIIPAYNVENSIAKCLNSVLNQTYKNLEIIIVNDASTDSTGSMLKQFSKKDSRIKIIHHPKNQGLFLARMTGIKCATGDYIGFVDSDDYISRDYYRTLEFEAERINADIVVGKLVQENESGYQWIQNIYEDFDFGRMTGKDIWNSYWKQEGQSFIWHTVWNKLYSSKVWKKALPILEKQKEHLIMCEDFIFSSIIFYYADTLSSVKYARYFYNKNTISATALDNNAKKYKKNVNDLIIAFKFIRNFLNDTQMNEDILHHYDRFEGLYKFFWTRNIISSSLPNRDKTNILSLLNSALKSNEIPKNPDYFYSVNTKYDNRYEKIIEWILSKEIKVISFDIFDTALVRPFYVPADLFEGLNEKFKILSPNLPIKFAKLRVEAEKSLREEKIHKSKEPVEDISLNEIYEKIKQITNISDNILVTMKNSEITLEKKYLKKRKSIFNLYQIAIHAHKKVIFTSDMYMDSITLTQILKKNGYEKIDDIFVSSEQNASKRTGTIYEKILTKLKIDGKNMMHLGDSWESDVLRAREKKIIAFFYPKTLECLAFGISDIETTHAFEGYKGRNNHLINFEKGMNFIGNRCAAAIVANELYDMPFVSYNKWSEMNASPQFMGYFALGMHLLGFTKWIADKSSKENYEKLIFIARDGYLPLQAYNIYQKYSGKGPKKNEYFYTSRKAVIPCGITNIKSLYSIYGLWNTKKLTGKDILNLLSPLLDESKIQTISQQNLQMEINNFTQFCTFVNTVLKNVFDNQKATDFNQKMTVYLKEIFKGKTALVDIGYSGRMQEIIYKLIGKPVDGFFIHKNEETCLEREDMYGFKIKAFYDFSPSITGGQREVIFSALAPSCIRYEISKDKIIPRFEKIEYDYPQFYLINELQKSALKFIEDFCKCFEDILDNMFMRNVEISYPFEHAMAYMEETDLKMFDCILFEDDIWTGGTVPLSEQWKENIDYHCLFPYHKIKAITKHKDCNIEQIKPVINYAWELYNQKGLEQKNIFLKMIFWLFNDYEMFKKRFTEKTIGKVKKNEKR